MRFDVVIVGGGHAGVEAACAAARLGAKVGMITFDPGAIGAMSCNPAIGGLGKGHLVREVDALDGVIARAADDAAIHYRMLNRSKGSAVWGPRVQADRNLFRRSVQRAIKGHDNIQIIPGEAIALQIRGQVITGVELASGQIIQSGAVILCTGTFLGGTLFRGEERMIGGRIGEAAATRLAGQMRELAIGLGRLKTGTPPRLDGRSIDWSVLDEQPSDPDHWTMSPLSRGRQNPQLFCAVSRTTLAGHEIIRANLDKSPMFTGAIEANGPRYCPSIEDKIHRFGDRDGHQVFLEPEGLNTHLVYPNGISTSLPADVQLAMLRTMPGLSCVEMEMPGYAVEYSHVDPRSLHPTLAMRAMPNLFCAGQINGTTGYEEAAAQGLVAGMHAACQVLARQPVQLSRDNSYLAVMLDDLTLQGISEPYRMLTARAEYRLRLRANNASARLTSAGIETGIIGAKRARWWERRCDRARDWEAALDRPIIGSEILAQSPSKAGTRTAYEWLQTGQVGIQEVVAALGVEYNADADADLIMEVCENAIYAPYIARQDAELRDLRANEQVQIPEGFNYACVPGLSNEMTERLSAARPSDLAAAGRVPGVTPAALAAVLVRVKRLKLEEATA